MHSDPIADFITRIKNGYMAKKPVVTAPYSKVKNEIATILVKEGYVETAKKDGNQLVVTLKYDDKKPAVVDLKRISKPGLRIYVNKKHVPSVLRGRGIAIVSTSQGMMTDKQAREKQVGGELIAKIW